MPGTPCSIMAATLRRHPDFPAATRRAPERRVRIWQALRGPERDVIFRLEHPPGQRGLSDLTDANPLGVIIGPRHRHLNQSDTWHARHAGRGLTSSRPEILSPPSGGGEEPFATAPSHHTGNETSPRLSRRQFSG
jgi:hypothetical protein